MRVSLDENIQGKEMAIEQDEPPSFDSPVDTSVYSAFVASENQEEVSISPRDEPVKKDVYNQADHEIPEQKNGGHFDSAKSDESLLYVGEAGLKNNSSNKTTTDLPVDSGIEDKEPTAELKREEELSTKQDPHEKEATGGVQTMDVSDGINKEPSQERQQTVPGRKIYDRNRASFPPPPPDYETAITRCVRLDPNPAGFALMPGMLPTGFSPGQPYRTDRGFVEHGAPPSNPNNGFAHDDVHFRQELGHDRMQDAPFEQDLYLHEPGLEQFSSLPPHPHDLGPGEVEYPQHENRNYGDFHSRPPFYGSAENILDMKDSPVALSEMSPQLSNSTMDISEHARISRLPGRKSALAGFLNRRKNLSGSWGSRTRQPRQSASSVFAGSAESIHDTPEGSSQGTMSLDRLNRHRPTSKRTYGVRSSSLDRMLDDDNGSSLVDIEDAAQEEGHSQRTASLDRLDRQITPSRGTHGARPACHQQQASDNDERSFDEIREEAIEDRNQDKTPKRTGSLDRINRQGSAYDRANRVKAASLEDFRQSLKHLTLKKDKPKGREGDQQQEQGHENQVTSHSVQKTPARKHLTPFIKFSPAFLEQERCKEVNPQQSPIVNPTGTGGQQSRLDDARQRANQLEELLNSKRQKMEEAKEQVRKIHQNLEDELTKQKQHIAEEGSHVEKAFEVDFSKSKDGEKKSKNSNETKTENDWSTVEFGHQSISEPSSHTDTNDEDKARDTISTKLDKQEDKMYNVAKRLLSRAEGSHQEQPNTPSFISFEGEDGPITPPPFSRNDPLPELGFPDNDYNPGNPFDLFLGSLGLPVMQGEFVEERRPSLSTIYEEDEPLTDSTANSVIDLTMEEESLVAEEEDEEGTRQGEEGREQLDEKNSSQLEETEAKEEDDKNGKENAKFQDVHHVREIEETKKVEVIQTIEESIVDGKEKETEVKKVNVSKEPEDMTRSNQRLQEDVSDKHKKMGTTQTDVTDMDNDSAKEEAAPKSGEHLNKGHINNAKHMKKSEEEEEINSEIDTLPAKTDYSGKKLDRVAEEKYRAEVKIKEESEDKKVEQPGEQKKTVAKGKGKALSSNEMVAEEKPSLIIKETQKEEGTMSGKDRINTPKNKEIIAEDVEKAAKKSTKEEDVTETTLKSENDDAGQKDKETHENKEKQTKEGTPEVHKDMVPLGTEEASEDETEKATIQTQEPSTQEEHEDDMRSRKEHSPDKSVAAVKDNTKKRPVVELTVNLKASQIGPDLLKELEKAKTPTNVTPVLNLPKSPKVNKKASNDKIKQSKETAKSSKETDKSKKNKNFMDEINALLEQTESTMVRRSTEITSVSEDLQNTAKTLFNLEVEEPVFTTSPDTTGSSHNLTGSASSLDSTEEDKSHISVSSPERAPVKSPEHQSSVTTPERQSDSGNGSLNESPFSVRAETLEKSQPPLESPKENIKTEQEADEDKEQESVKKEQTDKTPSTATTVVLETEKDATVLSEESNRKDTVIDSSEPSTKTETVCQNLDNKENLEQNEEDTVSGSNRSFEEEQKSIPKEVTITYKKINLQEEEELKQEKPDMKSNETERTLGKESPSQEMTTEQETTIKSEDKQGQENDDKISEETMSPGRVNTNMEIRNEPEKFTRDTPKPPETIVFEDDVIPNVKVSSENTKQENGHNSRVEMNVSVQDKETDLVSEDINNENDLQRQQPDIISDMPKVARSVEMFESLLKSNNQFSATKKDKVRMKPNLLDRNDVNAIADEAQTVAKTKEKDTTVKAEFHRQSEKDRPLQDQVEDDSAAEGIYTASLVYVGGSSFEESGDFTPKKYQNNESFEDATSPVFSPTHRSTPREGIFKAQLVKVNSLSFEEEDLGSEDSSSINSSSPSYELVRDEMGWKGKPAPRHSTPTGQEDTSPGAEDNSFRRGRSMRRRSQRRSFEGSLWDDEDFKHQPALLRQGSPPHKPEPINSPEVDTSTSSQKTTPRQKKSFKDFFRFGKKRSSSAHKAMTRSTPSSEEDKLDSLPTGMIVDRGSQSDTEDEPKGGLKLFYNTSKTKRKTRKGSVSEDGGERGCGSLSLGVRRHSWGVGPGRFSAESRGNASIVALASNNNDVNSLLRRSHSICLGTRFDVTKGSARDTKRERIVEKKSSSCSSLPGLLGGSAQHMSISASSSPQCPSIKEDASSSQSLIFESAL
ncbi:Hypp690 [Branchiostoma lanceolatum]|uniref:Hypp690 protein n=1 Tax=Branchiostoma lanceolatum TaxID=7740 RepID=A0A8J9W544_BRALA|nr:Hypp690 [Branchiostoma lanceolatum]